MRLCCHVIVKKSKTHFARYHQTRNNSRVIKNDFYFNYFKQNISLIKFVIKYELYSFNNKQAIRVNRVTKICFGGFTD